jgi:hypothetical protein
MTEETATPNGRQPMQAAEKAPPLRTHLELAALPTAVPCARLHVRSIAHEWGLPNQAHTAELVASELVTNSIQACERLRPMTALSRMTSPSGVNRSSELWPYAYPPRSGPTLPAPGARPSARPSRH